MYLILVHYGMQVHGEHVVLHHHGVDGHDGQVVVLVVDDEHKQEQEHVQIIHEHKQEM